MTELGWLSVRNLISLDTAVFVYKEINNLHPEEADIAHSTVRLFTLIQHEICQ